MTDAKGRSVAVAGGFGFVGSKVVENLERRGYSVIPFSRRNGVDIRDFEAVAGILRKEKPEVLVNCAAHVGGIAYNDLKPVEVYEDNLMIGFNLLRAAFAANVAKLVNLMPNCVYPGIASKYREDGLWDGPMHETVLSYGMPRKAIWVHAWALKKRGFKSVHLVLPNLYGPGDHFDPVRSHALGAIVRKVVDAKIAGENRVSIWGTGRPIREWMYVDDAAEGVVRAMERYDSIEIMNVGVGKGYTIRAVAEMVKKAARWKGLFVYDRSRPDGAPKKVMDVAKMRRILRWRPPTPILKGIAYTVRWYEERRMATGAVSPEAAAAPSQS